jgi:hypothetical protein
MGAQTGVARANYAPVNVAVEVAVAVVNAVATAIASLVPVSTFVSVANVPAGFVSIAVAVDDANVVALVAVVVAVDVATPTGPTLDIAVPTAVASAMGLAFAVAVAVAVARFGLSPCIPVTNATAIGDAAPIPTSLDIVVSDVSTGSDPATVVVTVIVVVVVFVISVVVCLVTCVIVVDVVVFVSFAESTAKAVTVIDAVALARMPGLVGAGDGAGVVTVGGGHVGSSRFAVAPSVLRNVSTIVQVAIESAHDKSQHKIWLNDVAPLNMLSNDLEFKISQGDRFWLKEVAPWNISSNPSALDTFQMEMF